MSWKKFLLSDDAVVVRKNSGANIGTRQRLNFIEGGNITLAISDDAGSDEIDISIASSSGYTHPSARQCTTGNWAWASITGKPSAYPPSAHETSHESGGSDAIEFDSLADGTTYKKLLATERTKLTGIETSADVTDATNVYASGAVMRVERWVVYGDIAANMAVGTIPAHSFIRRMYIHVTEAFNDPGTDLLEIGTSSDSNKFGLATDVSSTGIKVPGDGVGIGYNSAEQAVTAKYVGSTYDPTQGKSLVVVEYTKVTTQP